MLKIVALIVVPSALGGFALLHDPADGSRARQSAQLIEVGVTFEEAAIRDILPEGFTPSSNFTGGLALYVDQTGGGSVSARQGYIWIDINYRGSARYVIRSFPSAALPSQAQPNGQPVAYHGPETNVIEAAMVSDAQGGLVVTVEPSLATCRAGLTQASPYVFAQDSSGTIGLTHSPVFSQWCDAELLALDIEAPADDALSRLEPWQVMWVGVATPLE